MVLPFLVMKPEYFNVISYWNDEAVYGDAKIRIRINNYASFKVGYVTSSEFDNVQNITCLYISQKKDVTILIKEEFYYASINFTS